MPIPRVRYYIEAQDQLTGYGDRGAYGVPIFLFHIRTYSRFKREKVSVQGICPSGGCGGCQAPERFLFLFFFASEAGKKEEKPWVCRAAALTLMPMGPSGSQESSFVTVAGGFAASPSEKSLVWRSPAKPPP